MHMQAYVMCVYDGICMYAWVMYVSVCDCVSDGVGGRCACSAGGYQGVTVWSGLRVC